MFVYVLPPFVSATWSGLEARDKYVLVVSTWSGQ